ITTPWSKTSAVRNARIAPQCRPGSAARTQPDVLAGAAARGNANVRTDAFAVACREILHELRHVRRPETRCKVIAGPCREAGHLVGVAAEGVVAHGDVVEVRLVVAPAAADRVQLRR